MLSWLENIAIGALSSGVNKPTVVVLNLSLLGCIGCLVFLLTGAAQVQSWLVPHLAFLLVLAVGLWVSVNWFVVQLGTTPPEEQRRQVFGNNGDGGSGGDASADSAATRMSEGKLQQLEELLKQQ